MAATAALRRLSRALAEGNDCHEPAGSPKGGQFCKTGGASPPTVSGRPRKRVLYGNPPRSMKCSRETVDGARQAPVREYALAGPSPGVAGLAKALGDAVAEDAGWDAPTDTQGANRSMMQSVLANLYGLGNTRSGEFGDRRRLRERVALSTSPKGGLMGGVSYGVVGESERRVEVHFLATKPGAPRGTGLRLLAQAARLAAEEGVGLELSSLQSAMGFYRVMGMHQRQGGPWFQYSPKEAAELAGFLSEQLDLVTEAAPADGASADYDGNPPPPGPEDAEGLREKLRRNALVFGRPPRSSRRRLRRLAERLAEANDCHNPAGTPAGGQFCRKVDATGLPQSYDIGAGRYMRGVAGGGIVIPPDALRQGAGMAGRIARGVAQDAARGEDPESRDYEGAVKAATSERLAWRLGISAESASIALRGWATDSWGHMGACMQAAIADEFGIPLSPRDRRIARGEQRREGLLQLSDLQRLRAAAATKALVARAAELADQGIGGAAIVKALAADPEAGRLAVQAWRARVRSRILYAKAAAPYGGSLPGQALTATGPGMEARKIRNRQRSGSDETFEQTAIDAILHAAMRSGGSLGLPDNPVVLASSLRDKVLHPGPDYETRFSFFPDGLRTHAERRRLARAMYDLTQDALASRGVREVQLFRGVDGALRGPAADSLPDVPRRVRVRASPASAYSTDRDIAARFSGSTGLITMARAPAGRILCMPGTGMGCYGENEMVVLGEQSGWTIERVAAWRNVRVPLYEAAPVIEANDCHEPAGSPAGGQFCRKGSPNWRSFDVGGGAYVRGVTGDGLGADDLAAVPGNTRREADARAAHKEVATKALLAAGVRGLPDNDAAVKEATAKRLARATGFSEEACSEGVHAWASSSWGMGGALFQTAIAAEFGLPIRGKPAAWARASARREQNLQQQDARARQALALRRELAPVLAARLRSYAGGDLVDHLAADPAVARLAMRARVAGVRRKELDDELIRNPNYARPPSAIRVERRALRGELEPHNAQMVAREAVRDALVQITHSAMPHLSNSGRGSGSALLAWREIGGRTPRGEGERMASEIMDTLPLWLAPRRRAGLHPELSSMSARRRFVRAMYDLTQADLKALGIAEVQLQRGTQGTIAKERRMGDTPARVRIRTNPANAYSFSPGVAQRDFADSTGFATVTRVPASRILSLPGTGFGCLHEGEYVVLGDPRGFSVETVALWAGGARRLAEGNDCHNPAGSPSGGQFCRRADTVAIAGTGLVRGVTGGPPGATLPLDADGEMMSAALAGVLPIGATEPLGRSGIIAREAEVKARTAAYLAQAAGCSPEVASAWVQGWARSSTSPMGIAMQVEVAELFGLPVPAGWRDPYVPLTQAPKDPAEGRADTARFQLSRLAMGPALLALNQEEHRLMAQAMVKKAAGDESWVDDALGAVVAQRRRRWEAANDGPEPDTIREFPDHPDTRREIAGTHLRNVTNEVPPSNFATAKTARAWADRRAAEVFEALEGYPPELLDRGLRERLIRATYKRTQELLAEAGIDEVVAFRGQRGVLGSASAMPRSGLVELPSNGIASYSLSSQTAHRSFSDAYGLSTAIRVPASRVFSFPGSGPGCLHEYEVVLLGDPSGFDVQQIDTWKGYRIGEANDCHNPPGSPDGGQFCAKPGGVPRSKRLGVGRLARLLTGPDAAAMGTSPAAVPGNKKLQDDGVNLLNKVYQSMTGSPNSPLYVIRHHEGSGNIIGNNLRVTSFDTMGPEQQALLRSAAFNIAHRTGVTEGFASEVLGAWLGRSSVGLSAVVHTVVAEEFGLPRPARRLRRMAAIHLDLLRGERDDMQEGTVHAAARDGTLHDKLRATVRAMYDLTQRQLAQNGITEMVLYRGVRTESMPQTRRGAPAEPGQPVRLRHHPLAAFSISGGKAANYARSGEHGITVVERVPAARIFSLPGTGYGWLDQGEVVVLGPTSGYSMGHLVTVDGGPGFIAESTERTEAA